MLLLCPPSRLLRPSTRRASRFVWFCAPPIFHHSELSVFIFLSRSLAFVLFYWAMSPLNPHTLIIHLHNFTFEIVKVFIEYSKPNPSDPSFSRLLCKFNNLTGMSMDSLVFQVRLCATMTVLHCHLSIRTYSLTQTYSAHIEIKYTKYSLTYTSHGYTYIAYFSYLFDFHLCVSLSFKLLLSLCVVCLHCPSVSASLL